MQSSTRFRLCRKARPYSRSHPNGRTKNQRRSSIMSNRFDAIIIGTGQSGPSLAERFAKQGLRVAVIERKHFGGTCVNTGCIPTKTLVASAYVAHMARHAAEYGVDIGGPIRVDMERV